MSEQKTVDPHKQQQRKVYLVAALLFIPFSIFMWMIFGTSRKPQPEGADGLNYTVPEAREQKIEENKRKVMEKAQTEELQSQRLRTLSDNTFSLLDDTADEQQPKPQAPMQEADDANRALRRQLAGVYGPTNRKGEVERLREQVEELSARLDAAPKNRSIDPLELAEKQYQLAQKYLGGGQTPIDTMATRQGHSSRMLPVRGGGLRASTLNPETDFTQERNTGFLTAAGGRDVERSPTIRACIAQTQVIREGSMVALRLLEEVSIDGVRLPRNTPLYGAATISGARLKVEVRSVEYAGRIFAVEATAYDLDGQPGLNIPDSRERRAAKEALASIGRDVGMSVNVTRSAGQQVVSELSRGALQATTRYAAEKLKEVKITLKANHQLLLISRE